LLLSIYFFPLQETIKHEGTTTTTTTAADEQRKRLVDTMTISLSLSLDMDKRLSCAGKEKKRTQEYYVHCSS